MLNTRHMKLNGFFESIDLFINSIHCYRADYRNTCFSNIPSNSSKKDDRMDF